MITPTNLPIKPIAGRHLSLLFNAHHPPTFVLSPHNNEISYDLQTKWLQFSHPLASSRSTSTAWTASVFVEQRTINPSFFTLRLIDLRTTQNMRIRTGLRMRGKIRKRRWNSWVGWRRSMRLLGWVIQPRIHVYRGQFVSGARRFLQNWFSFQALGNSNRNRISHHWIRR